MIDAANFYLAYRQLAYLSKNKFPDAEVSFTTGLWNEDEGYKRDFWEDARSAMELEQWPAHRHDQKYITDKAMQPFGVLMRDLSSQQNLVSSHNYEKLFDIIYATPKEAAEALYDIFYGNDEEAAFTRFAKLLERKYMNDPISVVSLFFFLKDQDRYVTARKEGTGERLVRLGLNAACLQKCTWSGYQQYLSIVRELRDLLLPLQPEATLLDAQSFLWMLWRIDKDTPTLDESIPLTERALALLSDQQLQALAGEPSGNAAPSYTATTTLRKRNPCLSELAKRRANGVCQLCGRTLDYNDSANRPYLEVHHIIPLSEDGPDELHNMTALCPNCHRKMHIVNDAADVELLRSKIRGMEGL